MKTPDSLSFAAKSAGERELLAFARDAALRAVSRGTPCFSDFLSPAERSLLLGASKLFCGVSLSFFGGFENAERTMAVFAPPELAYEPKAPITTLRILSKGEPLGHRDVLGSLMALGIERGKFGDILLTDSGPVLFCRDTIAPYVCEQLTKIGRNSVKVEPADDFVVPEPKTEEVSFTVASPRLDAVLACALHLSRTDAADAVKKGLCFVNWRECQKPDEQLCEGDVVSLRGFGRFKLDSFGGKSRKDRQFITILLYV